MVATFTKWLRAAMIFGISAIITGVLFNLGQDLYNIGKNALIHTLPFQLIIPTTLGIIAVGLGLYGFYGRPSKIKSEKENEPKQMYYEDFKREQTKEELQQIDEDIQDPKAKSERDGKSRPSGIT